MCAHTHSDSVRGTSWPEADTLLVYIDSPRFRSPAATNHLTLQPKYEILCVCIHQTLGCCSQSSYKYKRVVRTFPQVQCLTIDSVGELLLTGDESGTICARLLHSRSSPGNHQGLQDTGRRSRELGVEGGLHSGGGGGGGVAKVVDGAHAGGIQAISHVEGSSRSVESKTGESSALFVSGGKGRERGKAGFRFVADAFGVSMKAYGTCSLF